MEKIKIYEIAKETGISNKEIIEAAIKLGFDVKSHMNSIESADAQKLKNSLKSKNAGVSEKKDDKKKDKRDATPVIIRREVIITDDEQIKKESKDKEMRNRRNDVGFVERDKNKDYNIVYRNKPVKPLTANELFGIKSKKQEEKIQKQEEIQAKVELKTEKKEDMEIVEKKDMIDTTMRKEKTEDNVGNKPNKDNTSNNKDNNVGNKQFNNRNGENRSNYNRSNYDGRPNGYNRFQNNRYNNENRPNGDNRYNNSERPNGDNRFQNNRYNNENRPNGDNRFQNNRYNNENRPNGDSRFQNNRYNNENRPNGDSRIQNNRYNNENRPNGDNRFQNNRYNNENRPNGDNRFQNNRYNNENRPNGDNRYNNSGRPNGDNRFQNNRNNGNGQFQRNNFNRNERRPLDERGIDKNIKDIMSVEVTEKESQRDYSSRAIDKQKQTKFEENKGVKKQAKSKKINKFENFDEEKLKNLKQVDKLSHMFNEQDGGMLDYYDLTTERGKRNRKKIRNNEERNKQKIFELTQISIPEVITVKDLALDLKKTSAEIIKKLFNFGIMATLNNDVDFDTAFLVAEEFGVKAVKKEILNEEDILFDESEDNELELVKRAPVVVVMGHVDHGKTSLLDAIRSTNVIEGEAGGITQHIGAYMVNINGRDLTFLDTPGHEAFTSMRARGAQITDIAILVVAADDGVMPQTIEAINHAKAANIPIIVAVNKIDLPSANVEKIKQELMQYELVAEEWGGDTIFVPISARNNTNIENLLEMVLLVADMKELKVNPNKQAKGTIIEARLDKTKGPIASVLVQRGTLDSGDTVVVGTSIGRIRAMRNDKGQVVKQAGPSMPVEIMGLTEVPEAGDIFYEVKNEKMAKHLIEKRKHKERESSLNNSNVVTLDNLFEKMETGDLKQLNLIVKADVQGTAEAVKQSLQKLSNQEVKVKVIHAVAGAITETDVQLAKAANAIIIGFNVRPVVTAKAIADKEGVEIKQYSIIYQAIEDVEAAMKGLLDPIFEEKVIGTAEIRQTFKVSNVGTIAGCYVTDGRIERNAGVRIIRDNVVIHEGKLSSLKRFKDDVKEAAKGYECGVQIDGYNDLKENDVIEAFVMEEVQR